MSTKEIGISLPIEVLVAIDKRRGDVARSRWIRRALEEKLQEAEET